MCGRFVAWKGRCFLYLLLGLAVLAAVLLISGAAWAIISVRRYRTEAGRRQANALAGMAAVLEEARKSEQRKAKGDERDVSGPSMG